MIDLKKVREDVDWYKALCKNKKKNLDVDLLLNLDDKRKEFQQKIDVLKHQQKELAAKKDYEWAKSLKWDIQKLDEEYNIVYSEYIVLLKSMPNFIHPDTPIWKTEDDNVIIKTVGDLPKFDFDIRDHEEIGKLNDTIDKETASKVSWARFTYLKGDVVLLQMSIIQYVFATLWNEDIIKKIIDDKKLNIKSTPFRPILPPAILNMDVMDRMWRLHPMDDRYCLPEDNQVFNWSAEHTMWPMFMDHMFAEKDLPVRYIWYSSSFRREAWTYWKDTKWILRMHQFDKMEMEVFSTWETSGDEQELIVWLQEYMMQDLKLPYQLVLKCTADMWSIDYRAIDIETRMPWQWKYRETHTSDNMTDYQARRLNTKVKRDTWDKEFVHMNDATAFALGRAMIAIIENNQTVDGKIKVPDVLRKYMGDVEFIG